MSLPLIYVKPLTMEEQLLIDTVTMKYEGIGESWVAWDRGDHIELMVPERIRRGVPWKSNADIAETAKQ